MPKDKHRPHHPNVRCDNPGCGKYSHWKQTHEYWFYREPQGQYYLCHECPWCIQEREMMPHINEAIAWIERRKRNYQSRMRRTQEYQWAIKRVQLEFPMLDKKGDAARFLRDQMTDLWSKLGPFIWRRRVAEDLLVVNMEMKQKLLRQMEEPSTTAEEMEAINDEIDKNGPDG